MIEERQLKKRSRPAQAVERRLYLAAAILFPMLVLAGFARTYYFRSFFDVPPLPSALVHLHGLLMTAWVMLFIAQVRLIAARRIRTHQQLGYVGVAVAVMILITGTLASVRAAKYGSASAPPDIPPLQFLAVPLFDLLIFAILFGGAIGYRRTPAAHKTLMLLTAINFLPPALGRVPIPALQAFGLAWALGLPVLLVILAVAVDTHQHGRFNKVFLAGALLLVVSYPIRIALMGTDLWLAFAAWMTGFV